MISVEPTTDEEYIKSVFCHPSIYPNIKDDSCPESGMLDFGAAMKIPGFFLRAVVNGVDAGCFWLVSKGNSVEAHTALLPNCRGRDAINVTKAALAWVFSNTDKSAVTSYAWSDCPAVAWFCRAVGMRPQNTERWPATRNGKLVDITYFKINREDI